eukprot:88891-Hanusia_phi.AAC.2
MLSVTGPLDDATDATSFGCPSTCSLESAGPPRESWQIFIMGAARLGTNRNTLHGIKFCLLEEAAPDLISPAAVRSFHGDKAQRLPSPPTPPGSGINHRWLPVPFSRCGTS